MIEKISEDGLYSQFIILDKNTNKTKFRLLVW